MRIQISSGQGPAECELAAELFYRQLQKEIGDIRMVQCVRGSKAKGFSSVIFETEEDMSSLEGSILWVCKSPYRPKHKRKNWYIAKKPQDCLVLNQVWILHLQKK